MDDLGSEKFEAAPVFFFEGGGGGCRKPHEQSHVMSIVELSLVGCAIVEGRKLGLWVQVKRRLRCSSRLLMRSCISDSFRLRAIAYIRTLYDTAGLGGFVISDIWQRRLPPRSRLRRILGLQAS